MDSRDLARLVGRAVRSRREALHWTQRDLAAVLTDYDSTWTAKRVGVLESDGVRGDRLTHIVQLCAALECSLEDLLAEDSDVLIGDSERSTSWLCEALLAKRPPSDAASPVVPRGRVGAHDPTVVAEMAALAGVDSEHLVGLVRQHFNGMEVLQVRDAIAGLTPETPPREAQARRGHATRKIVRMVLGEWDDEIAKTAAEHPLLLWTHGRGDPTGHETLTDDHD